MHPIITTLAFLTLHASSIQAEPHPVFSRNLSDYTDRHGQTPDGIDNSIDDTEAIQRALDDGPGIVLVGPGHYRAGQLRIPSGVTLAGTGPATVIRSNGAYPIIHQQKTDEWIVRDLLLEGDADDEWSSRVDKQQVGIMVDDCREFNMVGVTIRNFQGVGLDLKQTTSDSGSRSNLSRITATGNHTGIRFGRWAEYVNAIELNCQNNVVGCVIAAGNVKISASNINYNVDGLVIEKAPNDSHGLISNCMFNHNQRYALACRGVSYGMAIDNCAFFYGSILIEDCVGINITSGLISCSIEADSNRKANRIADNYIIEDSLGWSFNFASSIIVADNFDENGAWSFNASGD